MLQEALGVGDGVERGERFFGTRSGVLGPGEVDLVGGFAGLRQHHRLGPTDVGKASRHGGPEAAPPPPG